MKEKVKLAAIAYTGKPYAADMPHKKAHLKYLCSNAVKLVLEPLVHPAPLRLILDNKLLKPDAVDRFFRLQLSVEIQRKLLSFRIIGQAS